MRSSLRCPKRFGVADIMKHRGAASKGRAQIYPALARWVAAKTVRSVPKGVYEKVPGTTRDRAANGRGAK